VNVSDSSAEIKERLNEHNINKVSVIALILDMLSTRSVDDAAQHMGDITANCIADGVSGKGD